MNKSAFPKIEENKDNKTASTERGRAAVVFSLKNEVGGLVKALKLFQVKSRLILLGFPKTLRCKINHYL